MTIDEIGTHRLECCILHGCKYDDDKCPVATGIVRQVYICEECTKEGLKTVNDVIDCHFHEHRRKIKCKR